MANTTNTTTTIKWGDIVIIDFGTQSGSAQCGLRPALVVQNDKGNQFSPTTIVCAITSANKKRLPTHINVTAEEAGLKYDSIILLEQVRTIDKSNIRKVCGSISQSIVEKIHKGLAISFGM
ncbi:MAG: type II toxin-antitoxin system PemK/MazF family toxin [Bacteroidales bacterium]|nr:type II toxin-antitoxin system PemK/MazF family toxin [Bacteroidales bacterium]